MNYYNELPVNTLDEDTLMMFVGIYLTILAVVLVCCLVGWILRSLSLHSIAKRRGIRHAWLAWVPVGSRWILGSVADQYQHLVQGKVTSRRKIMLILGAVSMVLYTGVYGFSFAQVFAGMGVLPVEQVETVVLAGAIPSMLGTVVGIVTLVFYHICNYDLYRSCRPNGATAFLVLGIIFPVCEPFFYLACRKKDLGMVVPKPVTPDYTELPKAGPEF